MEEKITETGADINLWHINVMQYTTAIKLLGRHGKLRERKTRKYEKKEPGWMINITNRINAIRLKLSHVNLILKCKKEGKYTYKKEIIQGKLKRMYESTRKDRLIEVETRQRHDLSVQSKILRDKKVILERQRINSLFYSSPKNVYRGFRKNGRIDVEKTPPKEDVKNFWENIWLIWTSIIKECHKEASLV